MNPLSRNLVSSRVRYDAFSKRSKGRNSDFKIGQPRDDSKKRQTKENADDKMKCENPDSSQEQPDDVGDGGSRDSRLP